MRPHPAGTLVTGHFTHGDVRLVIRADCEDHLWQVEAPVEIERRKRWLGGPRWLQAASCVVCGAHCPPVDWSTWEEAADARRIKTVIRNIREEIEDRKDTAKFLRECLRNVSE